MQISPTNRNGTSVLPEDKTPTGPQTAEQRKLGRISGILRLGLKLAACSPLVLVCLLKSGTAQAGSWESTGEQWDSQGNYDQAIAAYTQAIAYCPTDSTSYNNRGWDWWKKGDLDKAMADYNQALTLCPTSAATYTNRGVVWDDKGEHDRAMADYQQAIALNPTLGDSFNNRGTVESSTGRFEQAKADFYRALSIDPNSTAALENLAFFQATCPDPKYRDGKKAFDNASLAYQLDGGAEPLNTDVPLAAAYAEFGDFNQAVIWQQKVVDVAPAQYKAMMIARLEQFKQHKPYRSVQQTNGPVAPAIPTAIPTPTLPAPVAAK